MTRRRQQRNNLVWDAAVIEKEKACNIHPGLPAGSLMHSTSGLFSFACLKFLCICEWVKSRLGTSAARSLFSMFHQRKPETLKNVSSSSNEVKDCWFLCLMLLEHRCDNECQELLLVDAPCFFSHDYPKILFLVFWDERVGLCDLRLHLPVYTVVITLYHLLFSPFTVITILWQTVQKERPNSQHCRPVRDIQDNMRQMRHLWCYWFLMWVCLCFVLFFLCLADFVKGW